MDEQALVKQIAGMFEAQSAQMRVEIQDALSAQEARMNERFDAIDERFNAVDERFNAIDVELAQLKNHVSEVVQAVGEQFTQERAEILSEVRTLAENIEGDKIRALSEEAGAHKETLADHEKRIGNLERLVSAG